MLGLSKASRHRNGAGRIEAHVLTIALLALAITGCGSDHNGTATPSGSLWVANRLFSSITGFGNAQRKKSGTPAPQRTNTSLDLNLPQGVVFDRRGNLWVSNCSDSEYGLGTVSEFSSGQLAQLGKNPTPTANVTLFDDGNSDVFNCPYGEQFDKQGNLWVTNRFNPDLVSFAPDQLKTSGVHFPVTDILANAFGDPEGIKFDRHGNLWIADFSQSSIFGYKAATLTALQGQSTTTEPDIINSSASLATPDALAFDGRGNLWVSDCFGDDILEYNAADLGSSGSPVPAVILTATNVPTGAGNSLSLDCPRGLAFDAQGNLWVSNANSDNFGSLVEFGRVQLAASGSPAPKVFLDSDSTGSNLTQPVLLSFGP